MPGLSPTTVVHVFGRMVRGGAEMRTLELMRRIDPRRFRVIFVALSGLPGELDAEVRSLGGDVVHLGLKPSFPWKFKNLLRRERVGVVHSHVHMFSGFILALARSEEVPIRIAHFRSMHDGSLPTLRRRWQSTLMRHWTNRHATKILAVSEGAMCSAWKHEWREDSRCEVIYNGLELTPFVELPDRDGVRREFDLPPFSRICIHVGRMAEAKNHPRVLAVFRRLAVEVDHCILLLVGRSNQEIENRLRELVQEYRLEERVIFAGERMDVPRLLKAADMMIFPSLWEGLPGSILEACAAGLPTLATDLPGVREIQSWFPDLIQVLSLQETDEIWSAAASSILRSSPQPCLSVHDLFAKTPFRLELTGERFSQIWANS